MLENAEAGRKFRSVAGRGRLQETQEESGSLDSDSRHDEGDREEDGQLTVGEGGKVAPGSQPDRPPEMSAAASTDLEAVRADIVGGERHKDSDIEEGLKEDTCQR